MNETIAYAIKCPKGNIVVSTVKLNKSTCIKAFLNWSTVDWKEVKKYGWTCVKIQITEATTT